MTARNNLKPRAVKESGFTGIIELLTIAVVALLVICVGTYIYHSKHQKTNTISSSTIAFPGTSSRTGLSGSARLSITPQARAYLKQRATELTSSDDKIYDQAPNTGCSTGGPTNVKSGVTYTACDQFYYLFYAKASGEKDEVMKRVTALQKAGWIFNDSQSAYEQYLQDSTYIGAFPISFTRSSQPKNAHVTLDLYLITQDNKNSGYFVSSPYKALIAKYLNGSNYLIGYTMDYEY